jgi:CubicO group peptidase (beta-lactamase class C family)
VCAIKRNKKQSKLNPIVRLIPLVILFIFWTSILEAQSEYLNDTTLLENKIDSLFLDFNDSAQPGVAIALLFNGNVVFEKGYGYADLKNNTLVNSSTIFNIASVSKQFTAFSILLLQDQGRLSLDDDIRMYIPEIPDFGTTITLRHLATHTSGLRAHHVLLGFKGRENLYDEITIEAILEIIMSQKELNFDPGSEYLYSNTGFILLAEIIARVSGMSFEDFVQTNIFNPLQMNSSSFYNEESDGIAYSYSNNNHAYKRLDNRDYSVGASNILTTVQDLAKWNVNFSSLEVGNANTLKQMNAPFILTNTEKTEVAYGQFVDKYKSLNRIWHSGKIREYHSYLGRFPDHDFSVIVCSNGPQFSASELAMRLADIYLSDHIIENDFKKTPPIKGCDNPSTKQLEKFSGMYWDEFDWYARRVYVRDDTLRTSTGINQENTLLPIGKEEFQILNSEIIFTFKTDHVTKKVSVKKGSLNSIDYTKYAPINYSKRKLKQFEGSYFSVELNITLDVIIDGNQLRFLIDDRKTVDAFPIKVDLFSTGIFYMKEIVFDRNSNREILGLRISSGRTKNIRFQKINEQQVIE